MAFTVIQAGSSLQFLDSDGALTTLTLPSNVTLRTDVAPRWMTFENFVILVNTPTLPITIDATGTVRPLTPRAPAIAPIVSAGAAGALTGTYAGIRVTFVIKDVNGNLISESDFSPASNSVTISSQNLRVTGIPTSTETISARRIYRPTTGGTVLFPWLDVDGNTVTQVEDDLSDAGLSLLAAPTLGNPPRLTLIKEWRNLLWGVGDVNIDDLLFSEPARMYSWPNSITVPGSGRDHFGIRSLMPRREALGVGRRDIIWQVTGETADDFRMVKLSENTGIESNESMVVYRDIVFWLWKDGVYQWDGNGIRNISDESGVSSWFNTNSYFNQDLFAQAFAVFDSQRLKYRLYLAAAGSNKVDRWVEYDLANKTWWGPHKTSAFRPTSAFVIADENDKVRAIAGSSSAFIWQEQDAHLDDLTFGIDFDVDTKFYDGATPDLEKYWGQPTFMGKAETSGLLLITPKVGPLNALAQGPIYYDMTRARQRLTHRFGVGQLLQLNMKHTKAGERVEIYGFQLPHHIIGRR